MSERRNLAIEGVRIFAPLLILAAGIGGFLVFGQKGDPPQRDTGDDEAALVETAEAQRFDGEFIVSIDGEVVPFRRETLSAEVSGRVTFKADNARSGKLIRKEQLLFKIDDTDYRLEVERLRAQLRQSNVDIEAVDVDAQNTQSLIAIADQQVALRDKELKRYLDAGNRSVTESEIDDVRLRLLTAKNSLQTLQNQLASAGERKKSLEAARDLVLVQMQQAQINAERTRVFSPVAGMVITDPIETNTWVNKGEPLLHVNDSAQADVRCSLLVEELYWIWLQSGAFRPTGSRSRLLEIPQTPVDVVFTFDGNEYVWKGVLSRYEGTGLDVSTRTVPCRVYIEHPTQVEIGKSRGTGPDIVPPSIVSGMYVSVRIPIRSPAPLVSVPKPAVRPGGQVWVVRDGKLKIVKADVARTLGDKILLRELPEGLKPGDDVVTSPLASVTDGMAVREAGK